MGLDSKSRAVESLTWLTLHDVRWRSGSSLVRNWAVRGWVRQVRRFISTAIEQGPLPSGGRGCAPGCLDLVRLGARVTLRKSPNKTAVSRKGQACSSELNDARVFRVGQPGAVLMAFSS